jgi:copper chaperone
VEEVTGAAVTGEAVTDEAVTGEAVTVFVTSAAARRHFFCKGEPMETTTLKISGMTCSGCVASVQRVLSALDGVTRADVSLDRNEASVSYEPGRVTPDDLKAAIEDAGYDVVG